MWQMHVGDHVVTDKSDARRNTAKGAARVAESRVNGAGGRLRK
jgi:hypothetical protein